MIFLLWAQTNTFLSGLPDDFGANGEPILCDWGFIADQIGVGCMNWMRFEEPIEPESVCRVTFSGKSMSGR